MSQGHGSRCLCAQAVREELRTVENRAVAIRKQLKKLPKTRLSGGKVSDAVQLAQVIEQLARLGQVSSAENAVDISSRIEALASILQRELDGIIALQVR